jgi:hypothetical protein
MIKVFRFLAICMIGVALATSSIAWAQTYTSVNYPGAVLTELIGGPNPQGTSVGGYTLTAGGALHGFTVRGGVFTPFDPPGSTFTTVNFINPRGDIVGAYVDASGVSHGFVLSGGLTQRLTTPARLVRLSVALTHQVKCQALPVPTPPAASLALPMLPTVS